MDAIYAWNNILASKDKERIRQMLVPIMLSDGIPIERKLAAAGHYCANGGDRDSQWLLPYLPASSLRSPSQQVMLANIWLWARMDRQARALMREASQKASGTSVALLASKALGWYTQNRWDAAIICWNAAYMTQKLLPLHYVSFCQFLLDAGRQHAAGRVLSRIREAANPQDSLRQAFCRCMAGNGPDQLQDAAKMVLEKDAGLPSLMKVFNPFATYLSFRLELPKPRACDLWLAAGYSQVLRAEWSLGRFHQDSLLAGSKFLVFAGHIHEAMDLMAERGRKDHSFVDGFAALSIYAWTAGRTREAEECLDHEPLDRPHDPTGWFRLAMAAGLLRRTDKTLAFLDQLYREAPEFFVRSNGRTVLGAMAILFRTMGWEQAAAQTALLADEDPLWSFRRHLMYRCPAPAKPVEMPPFKWPKSIGVRPIG